ncbi:BTB/POZ domain-containing protein KCTD6-like [Amphiura filiformis]|uniref:BTB/POZ domain-containing protein KCTD6-like n=1 Tax=Amphiura filiformis TaxID=82378 RepID=UPI003B21AF98
MAEIVKLNVGGVIYTTSRSTLTKYPNSMLGTMFSGRLPTTKDEHGNYWIDSNGEIFRYVLDFLRHGCLTIPEHFKDFELLEKEADFYQLPELTKAVKTRSCTQCGKQINDTEEKEHLVVKVSTRSYDSYVQIFGANETIRKLQSSLSPYKNGQINDMQCGEKNIVIHKYCQRSLPPAALKLELLNLGFNMCQNVPDEAEPEKTASYWFMKQKSGAAE